MALGYPWMDSSPQSWLPFLSALPLAPWQANHRYPDRCAPSGVADTIRETVTTIPGVVALERVRVRRVGPTSFIELVVGTSRTLPLDRVAALKGEIIKRVHDNIRGAEVSVTVDTMAWTAKPCRARHGHCAQSLAGGASRHCPYHGRALSISLDLEVDGNLADRGPRDSLRLEAAIQDEMGRDVEVDTHIEPLQVDELSGTDAAAIRVTEITKALQEIAATHGYLKEIHEVRVRETAEGEIVNFHCYNGSRRQRSPRPRSGRRGRTRFAPAFPTIKRVVSHAEPRGA